MNTRFEFKIFLIISAILMFNACKLLHKDYSMNESKLYFIKYPDSVRNFQDTNVSDSFFIKKYDSLFKLNKSSNFKLLQHPVWRPSLTELNIANDAKIEMMVCIDKSGETNFVKVLPDNSRNISKSDLVMAVRYLSKFRWEEKTNGQEEECGKYTLIFDDRRN